MRHIPLPTSLQAALAAALLLLAACAPQMAETDAADQDPLEGFNRGVYAFNDAVDTVVLEPVARLYRMAVPAPGRDGVKNFLANLTSPVVFLNNILQGDVNGAFTTFWRFVLNTTVGFGGVYDFATNNTDLKAKPEDFGQTLGTYGSGPGFYLVLPILGPSSGRDAVGRVADYFSDPFTYLLSDGWQIARYGATAVDGRSRTLDLVDEINKNSLDPYATIRSAYLQRRQAQVENRAGASNTASTGLGPDTAGGEAAKESSASTLSSEELEKK